MIKKKNTKKNLEIEGKVLILIWGRYKKTLILNNRSLRSENSRIRNKTRVSTLATSIQHLQNGRK